MTVFFYQAECGDAARIRYLGSDHKYHNIIMDSGFERTFRHVLLDEIQTIIDDKEIIDLWVVSHIHDDHIGGTIAYLNAIKDGELTDIVELWLYNLPRTRATNFNPDTSLISESKSISQGDSLAKYLTERNKLPTHDNTNEILTSDLFGLKITTLSPDTSALRKLRDKYGVDPSKPFEKIEGDSISEAKRGGQNDYHTPIDSFDLTSWEQDRSVENGSSIALLTEFQGKRILWLADAHPSIIVSSLKKFGWSKEKPLPCDWVKISHHGSKANNSLELMEMILCKNYLISADATNTKNLPTKECLARLLRNTKRQDGLHYKLYFTYGNDLLRNIFKVDGDDVFKKYNFSLHFTAADEKIMKVYDV